MPAKEAISVDASKKDTIVYTLTRQGDVEKLLSEQVKKQVGNCYFYLSSSNEGYTIFLDQVEAGKDNPYAKRTNRKLFLNNQYYPIVFDFDTVFAVTEDEKEVSTKFAASAYPALNSFDSNFHGDFYVSFSRRGEVISSGFDGLVSK
jgi:hypothetical protein